MEPTRPKTRNEALIWTSFTEANGWSWYDIRRWPTDLSQAVISQTLNYVTIFRLFMYFLGNGMELTKAVSVITSLLTSLKDKEHVKNLARSYVKGYMDRYSYWDEHLGRTIKLSDQAKLYEEQSKHNRVYYSKDSEMTKVKEGKTSGYDVNELSSMHNSETRNNEENIYFGPIYDEDDNLIGYGDYVWDNE